MYKVAELLEALNKWAPFSTQLSYDNSGLLVGEQDASFSKILVALDITDEVVDEAIGKGADLILTHHPLIFKKLASIDTSTQQGRVIKKLLVHDIQYIAAHTNIDAAMHGVSFKLGEVLGLESLQIMDQDMAATEKYGKPIGFGVVGELAKPMTKSDFLDHLCVSLATKAIRYSGSRTQRIRRIAVCGGTAVSMLPAALKQGVDAYVTADIKYHEYFHDQNDFLLVDVGHYESEQMINEGFIEYLRPLFPQAAWLQTRTHTNPMRLFVSSKHEFNKSLNH